MARAPDIDDVCQGYFVTNNFSDLEEYVERYLEEIGGSICLITHLSAQFVKDDEQRELHMSPLDKEVLDPSMDLSDFWPNLYANLFDPELWEGFESSGWTLVPNTECYWFSILPYQPNNTPNDTPRNTADTPDFEDDPDDPDNERPCSRDGMTIYDSFILAIALHFSLTSNPNLIKRSQIKRYPTLRKWIFENNLNPSFKNGKVTISNVDEWMSLHGSKFNIRIFSFCGNVIYVKTNNEDEDYIDLLWKYNKFKLITNLWSLLAEHADRVFCNKCKVFHRNERVCQLEIKSVKKPEIEPPELPEGKHSCVIYADFESYIERGQHYASGYAYLALDKLGQIFASRCVNLTETESIVEDFVSEICHVAYNFANDVTTDDASHDCKICGDDIGDKIALIKRNYINGEKGSVHEDCWEDKFNTAIVYFHNFRGYDSHYILKGLMNFTEISFLQGKSFEKFDMIRATYNKDCFITFKDTFNYLSTSLAKLVPDCEHWNHTPIDQRNNKGLFPYSWFDNPEKLYDEQLPPQEKWHNDLTNESVDITNALKVWEENQFSIFAEYHDYYCKQDVTQLADIFEEFRNMAIDKFNLDPAYFQGAPAYTWFLCLKQNYRFFKLIPNQDVYLDLQRNIRGGISQVMHRYANIENKPDESIIYLDINSLYSKCMTYKLPTRYVGKIQSLPANWIELYCNQGQKTAIACVDLYYPEHLHDSHVAYPLAPHKFNERLCTTFERKERYLVHAELLKFYLEEGLILEQVYYVYIFEQDYILKNYVENNIEERKKTNSKVLQTLYKLLNNSLYGKTCENTFKYKKYEVKSYKHGQLGKRNSFLRDAINFMQINDKVLIENKVLKVTLNKPIQIGFAVLEFAKREIYNFLFKIQKIFKDQVTPLYTDTDSIMFHFKHPKPEELLYNEPEIRPLLDFDKVPEHWKIRTPGTNKVNGLWSLECSDKIIEFVGLRAKTYCYRTDKDQFILKNKGITRAAVEENTKSKITLSHYRDALFNHNSFYVIQSIIQSKKHQISTKQQRKLALISTDEKRVVLKDLITSIPFGYKGEKYKLEYQNLL